MAQGSVKRIAYAPFLLTMVLVVVLAGGPNLRKIASGLAFQLVAVAARE